MTMYLKSALLTDLALPGCVAWPRDGSQSENLPIVVSASAGSVGKIQSLRSFPVCNELDCILLKDAQLIHMALKFEKY